MLLASLMLTLILTGTLIPSAFGLGDYTYDGPMIGRMKDRNR